MCEVSIPHLCLDICESSLSFKSVRNNSLSKVIVKELAFFLLQPGLKVNFLIHLQSFANKNISTSKFFPNVWQICMILTRKRLLVDIFLTHRLTKKNWHFASLRALILSQVSSFKFIKSPRDYLQ